MKVLLIGYIEVINSEEAIKLKEVILIICRMRAPKNLWFKLNNDEDMKKLYKLAERITPDWIKNISYKNQILKVNYIPLNYVGTIGLRRYRGNNFDDYEVINIDEYIKKCMKRSIY